MNSLRDGTSCTIDALLADDALLPRRLTIRRRFDKVEGFDQEDLDKAKKALKLTRRSE